MKRRKLVKWLARHDCESLREGSDHTVYYRPGTGLQTAVPRHTEIHPNLVRKICKDLDIPRPPES
jgi:hypothetical protein